MDIIRPIGPRDPEVDPLRRVERARDDESRDRERPQKRRPRPPAPPEAAPDGPVEGDDGQLHIDIRA